MGWWVLGLDIWGVGLALGFGARWGVGFGARWGVGFGARWGVGFGADTVVWGLGATC